MDNGVVCVRVSQITGDFAAQLDSQLTNQFTGLVLDLRFANGDKAVSADSVFSNIKKPLVILANGETHGAAAELAVQLRAAGRGIIIGSTNAAGKISPDIAVDVSPTDEKKFQKNPFANLTQPETDPNATNAMLPFIDHMSEAELVRKHAKDGELDEEDLPRQESPRPVIHDPELARAMDLLKALAVLNQKRG